jgi:hypothetical protein
MAVVRARERPYARRLAIAGVASGLLHAALFLLPSPRPAKPVFELPIDFDGLGLIEAAIATGSDASAVEPAPDSPDVSAAIEGQPPVEPVSHSEPEPSAVSDPSTASSSADSGPGGAGAGPAAGETGDPGFQGGIAPGTQALTPRTWVWPRTPDVVRKRKIDDFVMLQVLIGIDGRVLDTVTLHTIPDCDECTAAALEAARKFEFEPPTFAGRAAQVWTEPFSFAFRAQR